MWTIIFVLLMIAIFGRILAWGIKASWGLTKIVLVVVFFPLILIVFALSGLIFVALPILLIVGIVVLAKIVSGTLLHKMAVWL